MPYRRRLRPRRLLRPSRAAALGTLLPRIAGFDPYSLQLSNGPGSAAANAGVPLNQQTAWADSSRAGQWYNGEGYLGVGSATYGTLTIFRQTALTHDGVDDYDRWDLRAPSRQFRE